MIKVRNFHAGMGDAVARRTYLRRVLTNDQRDKLSNNININKNDPNWREWYVAANNSGIEVSFVTGDYITPYKDIMPETRYETWGEVAARVALGNTSCVKENDNNITPIINNQSEYITMNDYIARGCLLTSGRHLSHGDKTQSNKEQTVFTNCSTAATSYACFYLLLNGSGVGRDYSDDMMVVDWANYMPLIYPVIDNTHPDFDYTKHHTPREAKHLYGEEQDIMYVTVDDSREGWAKILERIEMETYHNTNEIKTKVIVADFSNVRGLGEPIMGMGGKPSSGPEPIMNSLTDINNIRGSGMKPWRATMYIDHIMASVVLVGGLRRSARISTKYWKDTDIMEFIGIKRPVEYSNKSGLDIKEEYKDKVRPLSYLWSSNNSVAITKEYWEKVDAGDPEVTKLNDTLSEYAFYDETGEPGIVNVDRLTNLDKQYGYNADTFKNGEYFGSEEYHISDDTKIMMKDIFNRFLVMPYQYIVNPCGEENLSLIGGFCVISDTVPFFCDNLEETLEVAKLSTRAMIRVNTMGSVYAAEVNRTNRIGVGITGVFEAAWKFFRVGFDDLINPDFDNYIKIYGESRSLLILEESRQDKENRIRSAAFWSWMGLVSHNIYDESKRYSMILGVSAPHTVTTIKPSGCRPINALTTTDEGFLTLKELMINHPNGEKWCKFSFMTKVQQDENSNYITKTFDNGISKVKRLTMNNGLWVESTHNHEWSINGQWKKCSDVVLGDSMDFNDDIYHINNNMSFKLSNINNTIVSNDISSKIAAALGRSTATKNIEDLYHILDGNLNKSEIQEWLSLQEINLESDIPPKIIRMSSPDIIISYINGFIEALTDDFTNIELMHNMQVMGLACGMDIVLDNNQGKLYYDTIDNPYDVVCIEEMEEQPTYDIEVNNEHWYYEGAIKSHNTVSKLFGLTEGWHLPPLRYYLRWVQFEDNNPILDEYKMGGYPTRQLHTYKNHTIVGFPTSHPITELEGISEHLKTGNEVSMEEQYQWLMLGEFFYIEGGTISEYISSNGNLETFLNSRGYRYGSQISVTIKVPVQDITFEEYKNTFNKYQRNIRCASVMPEIKSGSYEYLPEEPITHEEYIQYKYRIENPMVEDISREHVDCDSGACPIDFNSGAMVI